MLPSIEESLNDIAPGASRTYNPDGSAQKNISSSLGISEQNNGDNVSDSDISDIVEKNLSTEDDPVFPDRPADMPADVESWTPGECEQRKEALREAARTFVNSRISPLKGDLTLGRWNGFYRETLRSLEEADAEETLGTQGLYPLQILQSINQEKIKSILRH
jgi:hypothetical protein